MAVKADRDMNVTGKGHASRVTAMIGAFLFALAVPPYLRALDHDFVNYDDSSMWNTVECQSHTELW